MGEGSEYYFDLFCSVFPGGEDVGLHGGDAVAQILQGLQDAVGGVDACDDEDVDSCLDQSLDLRHLGVLLEVKHEESAHVVASRPCPVPHHFSRALHEVFLDGPLQQVEERDLFGVEELQLVHLLPFESADVVAGVGRGD